MTLVFNILNKETGAWLVIKDDQTLFSYDFDIIRGEDKSLLHLQKMLDNNKLKLEDFKACALLVKDASMTQVKIFTTTMNTLAWQFDWPIVADFYFKKDKVNVKDREGGLGHNDDVLSKLLKKLAKIKKFTAIIPEYSREVDISISKKQPKYKIVK